MNIFRNRILYILLLAIIVIGFIVFYSTNFLLDFWWFETLGYAYYFGLRETYRDIFSLSITLLVTLAIYINFKLVPKFITAQRDEYKSTDVVAEQIPSYQRWGRFSLPLFILSLLLTIPVLLPMYGHWEEFLLYFFSTAAGVKDPVYGKDISYYLFSYPVYTLIQQELLMLFALVFLAVAFLYWRSYKKNKAELNAFPVAARVHLTLLIVLMVVIEAWSIALERIEMLYEDRHEPVFFGPSVVEMDYQLPLIWLTFFVFLGAAIAAIYFIYKNKGKKLLLGLLIGYFVLLGLRQINFIPELIDNYIVAPNPVATQSKYIQYNIDATLDAFDLSRIETIDYPVYSSLNPDISSQIYQELFNIPLWDHAQLQNVYEQLQAIRPYYTFSPVAVDRYYLGDREYQVDIAARELTLKKLPLEAQNWENSHMRYTHGYGAVVIPSAQKANQPMQWLLSELSLRTEFAKLRIDRPAIYFGLADYAYAIVPNNAPIAANSGDDLSTDYTGKDGLRISSWLLKLVFAAYLQDEKVFFSTSINTRKSKLLIRRNILERVKFIAPFLKLDDSPYPVIMDKKIYWIMDAYTTSARYPVVKPVSHRFAGAEFDDEGAVEFNYIRNSVKIIVDAYNGNVEFYIVDPNDPIITAYKRAYPGLLKDISAIPQGLIKHLSYPQDLFTLQMSIYARYHQTDPAVFYQQNDALELANMEEDIVLPYYLTIDILDKPAEVESEREKFILVSPLSPIGRDNLKAIGIAGCLAIENCNEKYVADIYFYTFSKKIQVDGPAQVSALINQNPEISRYFTLWDQRGSKVIKGRMIIIPVERSILYIQPIYLVASSNTGFPQLAKVIVSMYQQTAIGDSIESAYRELEQKINENRSTIH